METTTQMGLPTVQDFQGDLRDFFTAQLILGDYTFPRDEAPLMIASLFYAMRLRTIPCHPRVVRWSVELESKRVILAPDVSLALSTIEAECLGGMDLNPRMSRSHKDVECHDNLFNDWGIHHLHLGARSSSVGSLAASTKALLLIVVKSDAVYFLDKLNHPVSSIADAGVLEIVHKNWPALIAHARAGLPAPYQGRRSAEKHAELRKMGVQMVTTMSDGTRYFCPGGGSVMSGVKPGKRGQLNAEAVALACDILNRTTLVHLWCKEHIVELVERIRGDTGIAPSSLRDLHLRLYNDELFLVETTTGAILRCQ